MTHMYATLTYSLFLNPVLQKKMGQILRKCYIHQRGEGQGTSTTAHN